MTSAGRALGVSANIFTGRFCVVNLRSGFDTLGHLVVRVELGNWVGGAAARTILFPDFASLQEPGCPSEDLILFCVCPVKKLL